MMGTADEIVKAPEKGPVFMEDLPEEEQVVAVVRSLSCLVQFNCPYLLWRLWCFRLGRHCISFTEFNWVR